MEKCGISTVFLGICAFFGDFWPDFAEFAPEEALKPCNVAWLTLRRALGNGPYLKPKSTFLRGARAAAIGVFSASTMGAANRK